MTTVPAWLHGFPGIVLHLDPAGTVTGSNGRAEAALAREVTGQDMAALLDGGSSTAKWRTMLDHHGAGAPPAGSSSFSVAAARSIAASLISLAWAKAVVSPDTPRSPKPDAVL